MEDQSVQNSVQEPVTNPISVVPPVKNNNFSIIFFAFLTLLLIGSTAFLYYQNMQLKNMLVDYQVQPTASPTPMVYQSPNPSNPADPTLTWKSYIDIKNGFSFKYPSEWTYKIGGTNSTTGDVTFNTGVASGNKEPNATYVLNVSIETQSNLNEWTKYESTTSLPSQTINGLIFDKYIVADMDYHLDYILKQNGKIFRFYVFPYNQSRYPEDLKIKVDQILSTFSFTK